MWNDIVNLYSEILHEFSICCADLSIEDHAKMLEHFANNKEGFSIYPPYQKASYKTSTPEEVVEGYRQCTGGCPDNRHVGDFAHILYTQCMTDMRRKMTQSVIDRQLSKIEKATVIFEVVSIKGDVETVLDYKLLEDATLATVEDAMMEAFDKLNVAEDNRNVVYPHIELEPSVLFGNKRRIFATASKVTNETSDILMFRVTTLTDKK
jgi:hypothetical protein